MSIDTSAQAGRIGVGLMCKAPRIGVSKTRLAAAIGAERAAAFSAAFLRDMAALLEDLAAEESVDLFAFFAPADAEAELRALLPQRMSLHVQDGRGLGEAMAGALTHMLARTPAGAVVIGSDLPSLPLSCLVEAVRGLRDLDEGAVFGPAEDGGFYLAGIKSESAATLFDEMVWSTRDVMSTMRARASRKGVSIREIPAWYDVDDAESLAWLKRDLCTGKVGAGRARATRRLLEASPDV